MTALPTVLRGALRQAGIELRIQLMSWMAVSWFLWPALGLIALYFLRDTDVAGSGVSVAQLGIPGLLVLTLLTGGFLGLAGQMITERDDGTLLRAKTVPHAMGAHLLAVVLTTIGTSLVPMLALLVGASLIVDGVTPDTPAGWVTLLWVSLLGLLASLPWGALLGALLKNAMLLWVPGIGVYAVLAVSGVFYPIDALPGWLRPIGEALPAYWMGLGFRAALLPPESVVLEVGQTWRLGIVAAVLGIWAAAGLLLAPIALRRMVRRQSGSAVTQARERMLARGY